MRSKLSLAAQHAPVSETRSRPWSCTCQSARQNCSTHAVVNVSSDPGDIAAMMEDIMLHTGGLQARGQEWVVEDRASASASYEGKQEIAPSIPGLATIC